MEELQELPHGQNIRLASFDITNMYTNIPTSKLPKILKLICTQHNMTAKFTRELIKLMRTLLKTKLFQLPEHHILAK
jgi:hypothetical protein